MTSFLDKGFCSRDIGSFIQLDVLVVTNIIIFLNSGICKSLNNCIKDKFVSKYNSIVMTDEELLVNQGEETGVIPEETPIAETSTEEILPTPDETEQTTEAIPEATPEADNSAISQYFPNVEVTEANRAELEDASTKLSEYEGNTAKMEKINAANRELMAILSDNEWVAEMLIDLKNGVPPDVALAKQVDLEAAKPIEGEAPNPAYEEAKKTRMSRMEEKDKRKQMYADNETKSIEALRKFKEEKQMPDEDFDNFFKALTQIISAAFDGELSQNLLESIYYSLNRDADMEASKQIGVVEGRNEKILNKIQSEEEQAGDGLPNLNGTGKTKDPEKKSEDPFVSDLKRLGDKKPII
jgi:hypothetical protein